MIVIAMLVMLFGGFTLTMNALERKWSNCAVVLFIMLALATCIWFAVETRVMQAEIKGRLEARAAVGR